MTLNYLTICKQTRRTKIHPVRRFERKRSPVNAWHMVGLPKYAAGSTSCSYTRILECLEDINIGITDINVSFMCLILKVCEMTLLAGIPSSVPRTREQSRWACWGLGHCTPSPSPLQTKRPSGAQPWPLVARSSNLSQGNLGVQSFK